MVAGFLFGALLSPVGMGASRGVASFARPKYRITATYVPEKRDVVGHMELDLPVDLPEAEGSEIFFRLYPNVFHNWKYGKLMKPEMPGFLTVRNVKVNGQDAAARLLEDPTILQVTLPQRGSDALLRVEMDYHLRIPQHGMRLTQDGGTAFLAQWYPMLAVRDPKGWHLDPFTTTGDPFYTRVADFQVSFQIPSGYRVVSTGRNPESNGTMAKTVLQQRVRDFTAMITSEYQGLTSVEDGVRVNLWYRPEMKKSAQVLHRAAASSLRFFSEKFGSYRDETMDEVDVVLGEAGYGIAGMEYPGLITSIVEMGEERTGTGEPAVNVVAHEMAHQWWYGLVGNDQSREPWVDEGLTTFSEFLYMREVEKKDGMAFLRRASMRADEVHRAMGLAVTEPILRYPDSVYALMVYLRPAAMMFSLSSEVGGMDSLLSILQEYSDRYRYGIATGCDFIQLAESRSGKDLRDFFQKWLYQLPQGCSAVRGQNKG